MVCLSAYSTVYSTTTCYSYSSMYVHATVRTVQYFVAVLVLEARRAGAGGRGHHPHVPRGGSSSTSKYSSTVE